MITPLLDLFVALIPFLIMSVALTKVNIVDVALSGPGAVAAPPSTDDYALSLRVHNSKAEIFLNNALVSSIPATADKTWIDQAHVKLVELKRKRPEALKIHIEPQGRVSLELLMSFMDASRELRVDDAEIKRKDEVTGKTVRLRFLFPQVVLKGVYG